MKSLTIELSDQTYERLVREAGGEGNTERYALIAIFNQMDADYLKRLNKETAEMMARVLHGW